MAKILARRQRPNTGHALRKFIQGRVLDSVHLEGGHTISFHEMGSGVLTVRESGKVYQHVPLVRTASQSAQLGVEALLSIVPSDNAKLRQTIVQIQRSWPEGKRDAAKLVATERRLRKRLPALKALRGIYPPPILVTSRNISGPPVYSPADSSPCIQDGFWHSWECDAAWFQDLFCRQGGFSSVYCVTNIPWAASARGADVYFEATGCNASFDADAYFSAFRRSNDSWIMDFGEYVPSRTWVTYSRFADIGRLLGESYSAIYGLRRGSSGEPRIHFSRRTLDMGQ
jgi:hypothetical protein